MSDTWRPKIHTRVIHGLLPLQCPPKKLKSIGAEQSLKIERRLFKRHLWTYSNPSNKLAKNRKCQNQPSVVLYFSVLIDLYFRFIPRFIKKQLLNLLILATA